MFYPCPGESCFDLEKGKGVLSSSTPDPGGTCVKCGKPNNLMKCPDCKRVYCMTCAIEKAMGRLPP